VRSAGGTPADLTPMQLKAALEFEMEAPQLVEICCRCTTCSILWIISFDAPQGSCGAINCRCTTCCFLLAYGQQMKRKEFLVVDHNLLDFISHPQLKCRCTTCEIQQYAT